MAYGGSIKLTGESEYRNAIKNITRDLQGMSSALKSQTADFNSNDKSIKNTAQAQKQLNETIKTQQNELSKAKSSLAAYQVALQNQTTKHNLLNKEYKNAVTELEKIKKASGESSTEYQKQAKVVDKLEKELIDSTNAMNNSKEAMSNLKSEINNSSKTINNAEKALNDLGNEAEDSGKKAKKGSDGFTVMKGVLANLSSQAITAAINGLKKLSGVLIDVGKQAISSYAEYEQLVGGVETLFKDSAKIVQENAEKAYKTAGISANKYMEQATSFSASLLQGLGGDTKKAAEIADLAIKDMSDNANKMGTSIEMIQNAYQGFAKDNFTMLDNLKLGYGGTAGEMAKLINETGVLGNSMKVTAKTVKDVPLDKMIEAIHQVQVQMGITGTTSKEAASTIQGSVNSMKAAWSNLLVAIADDNQDLSKSVDEFVDSAIIASKNLVPRVKKVVEGIKKLINSIVNDVFPKLKKEIPQLAPLIDTFQWFIKNRQLVVNAIGAMVGAFAVSKILSFTKTMSDVAKSILTAATTTTAATVATNANTVAETANTTAKVAGTAATSALTVATNLLNAAWKANPIGLVIAGVTALIGVFGLLNNKTDEATEAQKAQTEALKEQTDKINQSKDAWNSLKETQQNQINVGMTEISHLQALQDELAGLVDKNGKVKDGYEARASFITSTLNDALGTEISMVDGVIQNYDTLKTTLDEVMEKKKAQIILDSQESLFKEAMNGQTDALKRLSEAESMLTQKKTERKALEDELAIAEDKLADAMRVTDELTEARQIQLAKEVNEIKNKMAALDEETANYQSNYDTQQALLEEYAYNIGQYEQNMALAHEGKYDEMSTVNWEYVKDYQKAGDAEKASLEDQVKTTEQKLEFLKQLKDKSGSDLYNSQIAAAEKQLSNLKENLSKYNSTTQNGLFAVNKTWLDGLNTELKTISGKNIEFRDAGNGNVQFYEDGIAKGTPMAVETAGDLSQKLLNEIDVKDQAFNYGEYFSIGTGDGIENGSGYAYQKATSFGQRLLNRLKNALDERSPSKATKEMGQYLIEGLGIGMEDEESSLLKQVTNFGKSVIGAMNTGLSDTINTSAIADIGSMSNIGITGSKVAAVNQAENNIDIVEAFKTALSQMKIELDDEVAGEFVEKTVTKVVYN